MFVRINTTRNLSIFIPHQTNKKSSTHQTSTSLPMNWTRGRVVGRGSTATVSLATAHPSGEVLAVKSADLSHSESLKRERDLLCTLNCPQIVAYKGCDTTLENGRLVYNLFMEYAPGGSIADLIRARGRLDEAAIVSHSREVLLGLEHLHARGIVHCDVKGQNVLVAADGVRVADLGCAKWARDSHAPIAGTPVFMSPEAARGEEQGFAADVWAFGCVVVEMATGRPPWVGAVSDPVAVVFRIGHSGEVPEIPGFVSERCRDFLGKCFLRDPRERWSARELLKHAFLEEPTNFVFEKIGGFNSDTPTSVLDQGLWGSISGQTRSVDPPAERVRRLSGGVAADLEEDDDWVTVRSNGGREEGGLLLRGTETVGESEEESNSNSRELINENGSDNIGDGDGDGDGDGGKDSCCCEIENKGTFVTCNCNKYHVTYGNLNLKRMDNFLLVSLFILQFFLSFLQIHIHV